MSASPSLGIEIENLVLRTYQRRLSVFCRHPLLTAITFLLVILTIQAITAIVFGGFANTPGPHHNMVDDPVTLLAAMVSSLTIYYYFWFPRHLRNTFDSLVENQVFAAEEVKVNEEVKKLFTSKWIPIIHYGLSLGGILIISAFIFVYAFFSTPRQINWWFDVHPLSFLSVVLMWLILGFAAVGLAINWILSVRLINSILHKYEIRVYPFHVDQVGGFGPLGHFSFRLTVLVLGMGLLIVLIAIIEIVEGRVQRDYLLPFWSLAYALVVPILFYLPIHNAHKAMLRFRDNLIKETSIRYFEEHQKIREQLPKDADSLDASLKYLEGLEKLQKHNLSYPVWPFSMRIRLGVLLNAVTPLATTIIGIVIERIF